MPRADDHGRVAGRFDRLNNRLTAPELVEGRGTRHRPNDRGSVAAELAIALPAVALTLALGLGALGAAARQVSLQDAVADAARLYSRGESETRVREAVRASIEGARLSTYRSGELICVIGELSFSIGRIISVPLRASACALDGGR